MLLLHLDGGEEVTDGRWDARPTGNTMHQAVRGVNNITSFVGKRGKTTRA